jgi:hypothetical protein
LESFLAIPSYAVPFPPVSKHLYQRIKMIEDRVLALEKMQKQRTLEYSMSGTTNNGDIADRAIPLLSSSVSPAASLKVEQELPPTEDGEQTIKNKTEEKEVTLLHT